MLWTKTARDFKVTTEGIDKLLKMSYSPVERNIPSQKRSRDVSINVYLAQCAEMCLYGNVAKTHLPVLLESAVG